jgi:hypothetical protein
VLTKREVSQVSLVGRCLANARVDPDDAAADAAGVMGDGGCCHLLVYRSPAEWISPSGASDGICRPYHGLQEKSKDIKGTAAA